MTKLWTIQTPEAWETLRKNEVLRGDGRRVFRQYREVYRWMMGQMMTRLPACKGGWPLWLWMRWNDRSMRPDLRFANHLPRGTTGVRIELDIPSQQILPHDFDFWHFVLHNDYCARNEREGMAWEESAASKSITQTQQEKEKSWERIFSKRVLAQSSSVAAVIEEIRIDQVRAIHSFVAR